MEHTVGECHGGWRWNNAQVDALSGFLNSDSPWLDGQNTYSVWRGEINRDLQQGGFTDKLVQQFDSWVDANSPSQN